MPTIDDAMSFLVDYLRTPRKSNGYSAYGYDVFLPNVVMAFIDEIECSTEHPSTLYSGGRSRELSPAFFEAAWELCRRGLLRPGVPHFGAQGEPSGAGYSLTKKGREWLSSLSSSNPFILL